MQDTLIYGGVVLFIALLYAFIFAACRAAGRYDEQIERLTANIEASRERARKYQATGFDAMEALKAVVERRARLAASEALAEEPEGMTRSDESGTDPTPVEPKPKRRTWGRE